MVTAPACVDVTAAVSPPALSVTVIGHPAPQGSKRHVGKGRMVESSKYVRPWREAVVWAARQATAGVPGWAPLAGPLAVSMIFTFARPKGHHGTGRNAGRLKPSAPPRPAVVPDLSKLARSTEDALTDAGVYADDALIVEYQALGKYYASDRQAVADVLDVPGCVIRLYPLDGGRR